MLGGQCDACYVTLPKRRTMDWRHDFAPAEPECIHLGKDGCCFVAGVRCTHGCAAAADELSQQTQDMEQLASGGPDEQCENCGHRHEEHQDSNAVCLWRVPYRAVCGCQRFVQPGAPVPVREDCGVCGEPHDSMDCPGPPIRGCDHPDGCQFQGAGCLRMCAYEGMFRPESSAPAPRRPPYAVAYATEGGAQYEIALPGDASVRAEDGALIVTHDSAVLALSHVRPMEGQ